jgi:hypothetical protein
MPAGELFSHVLELPIPDIVPPGVYALCVTAELGDAVDTSCASITLDEANMVTSFTPLVPTGTEDTSWGDVKAKFK